MHPRMTWQLVNQDEEVIGETSLLPPDARPLVVVSVNTVDSDDGAGDVFVKYRRADARGERGTKPASAVAGDWSPPELTDCPVLGYAAVDDFRYDMCVCGKRHVTVTAYGPDDRPL